MRYIAGCGASTAALLALEYLTLESDIEAPMLVHCSYLCLFTLSALREGLSTWLLAGGTFSPALGTRIFFGEGGGSHWYGEKEGEGWIGGIWQW